MAYEKVESYDIFIYEDYSDYDGDGKYGPYIFNIDWDVMNVEKKDDFTILTVTKTCDLQGPALEFFDENDEYSGYYVSYRLKATIKVDNNDIEKSIETGAEVVTAIQDAHVIKSEITDYEYFDGKELSKSEFDKIIASTYTNESFEEELNDDTIVIMAKKSY